MIADVVQPVAAPQQRRKTGMDWFYRLLDVEYGIALAVEDANRTRHWQAALFSFVVSGLLLVSFALLWIRYDLWSTMTVFMPVTVNILEVIPEGDSWGMVRWIAGLIMGVASAFFTTLVQWAYARMAAKHDAMLWAFVASCLFDLATDYLDVSKDFPGYFSNIIDAAATVSNWWWLGGVAVCIAGAFIWAGARSLYVLGALACGVCLFSDPSLVARWIVIFIGTIFCSFAAQSLVLIHGAKCITLFFVGQRLKAQGY